MSMPSDVVRSNTRVMGPPPAKPEPLADTLSNGVTAGTVVDAAAESGFGAFAAAVATVECLGALPRPRAKPPSAPTISAITAAAASADRGLVRTFAVLNAVDHRRRGALASTMLRRAASSAVTGAASRSSEVARSCRNALISGRGTSLSSDEGRSVIGNLQGCVQAP